MEYNDFELVSLAKEHNEEATKIIYDKYRPIIVKKSNSLYSLVNHHGVEINDLIQEGLIGLGNAINNFSEDDNVTFYTFAMLCIERSIFTYIRSLSNNKHKLLNEALQIDEGTDYLFKDSINIENDLITQDYYKNTIDKVYNGLSKFEKSVFYYKLRGYTISEISKTLNRDSKVIYNTLDRIKNKIKVMLQDE